MRYLTVTADYHGTGVKDDFSGEISLQSLGIPTELIERMTRWVADYQLIIPLNANARSTKKREIEDLDKIGLAIARDLKVCLGDSVKVGYYSEGKLARLPLDGPGLEAP